MNDMHPSIRLNHMPAAADPGQAALGLERWREQAALMEDGALAAFAKALAHSESGRALLDAVFGNSPFLGQALLRQPAFLRSMVIEGFDTAFAALLATMREGMAQPSSTPQVMEFLRVSRERTALLVALADMTGSWPVEQVTRALSDFADAALQYAVSHLLREAAEAGHLALRDPADPQRGSGLAVFALGKLGARELNYSSDIDIVVLYDEERFEPARRDGLQKLFVRITRSLIRLLEERTRHGYVFRTDLRLRPDPGATPLALSVEAAETYYESLGQNWERAAFIKCRPVAGDPELGEAFVRSLRPFLWRRHLDFAAIQDIHSIKRQINARRGGNAIAIAGHNIKLGRGGIREIEFFAQTQQLIWGGRDPTLRTPATCDALRALVAAGRVAPAVAEELIEAYRFLRRVEHRLQMTNDEQTQTLPESEDGLRALAVFLGYPDRQAFAEALLTRLRRVEEHYAELFEEAPALGGTAGDLVFTGGEDDPETLRTLERLGFRNPAAVSATVRGWHHGRYRATRSTRARELLTELMPHLLSSLARTASPDTAFLNFDTFLARLPAGVQLFSLFYANPNLLNLVAEIMGSAPRLAERLSRNPSLLDSVLSDAFAPRPAARELRAELAERLRQARDFQDVLDISRRWTNDRRFHVGLGLLRGSIDADAAGAVLSDIADAVIAALQPLVEEEFARQHGFVPGTGMAIVALGKLGSREMTVTSDLDLIFIYDDTSAEASDGAKPLAPTQYFARLGQRMIGALTALTGEGQLYEVDMRLRPSGHSGPIATSLQAFRRYHQESAWTWEHMALTRARAVSGPPALRDRVAAAIRETLTRPRDPDRLLRDVAEMRARMAREHKAAGPWEIKHLRGGLVDVEFIAQYLQLRHAHEHPEVLTGNTAEAFERLAAAGLMERGVARQLIEATRLWRRVQNLLRLTVEGRFREEEAPEALRAVLARGCGSVDLPALRRNIIAAAEGVYDRFVAMIEQPAGELSERRAAPDKHDQEKTR